MDVIANLCAKSFMLILYFFLYQVYVSISQNLRCVAVTSSFFFFFPFFKVQGSVQGIERAYEALGITLATNGEPRLQPYTGKERLQSCFPFYPGDCDGSVF